MMRVFLLVDCNDFAYRGSRVAAPDTEADAISYRKSAEEHTDAFQRGVDVNAVIRLIESDKSKAEAAHNIEGKPGERPILGSIHRKTAIRFGPTCLNVDKGGLRPRISQSLILRP